MSRGRTLQGPWLEGSRGLKVGRDVARCFTCGLLGCLSLALLPDHDHNLMPVGQCSSILLDHLYASPRSTCHLPHLRQAPFPSSHPCLTDHTSTLPALLPRPAPPLLSPPPDMGRSLGVVAFELWHPFSTGMERATLLHDLRDQGKMPQAWEAQHPQVARLIR